MSKDYLEYSLHELPNLLALEIRQNMLWDKNKKLWPEAVEKFTKSVAKQNPLSSYIHKNMNTKRLGQHINKTPHHTVIPGKAENDYQMDWHIEDGRIISPFGEYAYGVRVLDTFSKKHSNLKPYEPYFEPTGRVSDFAFLNTTGPVGLKFDTAIVENCCIVFDEETIDNDLSCINFIVDVGNHSHVTLEEVVKPKLDSCKLIKITYLVRQGAKLEIVRRTLGDDSSLTVVDSKFICFPDLSVMFFFTFPNLILGPCKSPKIAVLVSISLFILLIIEIIFNASSWFICEKFNLQTLTPEMIIFLILS